MNNNNNNNIQTDNYYSMQLSKVKPELTEFPPTLKIFANGNGVDTNHLSLNVESSKQIILWLSANFLNNESLSETIIDLNKLLR